MYLFNNLLFLSDTALGMMVVMSSVFNESVNYFRSNLILVLLVIIHKI